MTEPPYTPGPWQAVASQPVRCTQCYSIRADPPLGPGRLIATTRTYTASPTTGQYPPEHEANARLLAAAPELLAALKRLLRETSYGTQPCDSQTINSARAAIAKAEGKRP